MIPVFKIPLIEINGLQTYKETRGQICPISRQSWGGTEEYDGKPQSGSPRVMLCEFMHVFVCTCVYDESRINVF
jgi:hypothetical protein